MRASKSAVNAVGVGGPLLQTGVLILSAWAAIVGLASPAEQPAAQKVASLSIADRKQLLAERDRFDKESADLEAQGKYTQAIAAAEKMLAIEWRVFGDVADDVAESLARIGRCHLAREDFAAARKALTEGLSIRSKQYGNHDWRVSDARRELQDVDVRAGLTAKERGELVDADRVMSEAFNFYRQGDFQQAIRIAERVANTRRRFLGNDHRDTATSLNNLALLYESTADYAKAEPLHRQALEAMAAAAGEAAPPADARRTRCLAPKCWKPPPFLRASPRAVAPKPVRCPNRPASGPGIVPPA
jgi:tetratricopeptide (TPR) repeat protein